MLPGIFDCVTLGFIVRGSLSQTKRGELSGNRDWVLSAKLTNVVVGRDIVYSPEVFSICNIRSVIFSTAEC